jgi:hypothetical protein
MFDVDHVGASMEKRMPTTAVGVVLCGVVLGKLMATPAVGVVSGKMISTTAAADMSVLKCGRVMYKQVVTVTSVAALKSDRATCEQAGAMCKQVASDVMCKQVASDVT